MNKLAECGLWQEAFPIIRGVCPGSLVHLIDRIVFIDNSDAQSPRLMQIQAAHGQSPTPFGPPCSFHRPHHLSTTPDGGLLVTDTGNHRVMYLAPSAENWSVVAGGRGNGSGTDQLCFPKAAVASTDGIIVADTNNHRVLEFFTGSTEGFVVAGGQGKGNRCDQLSGPCGVAMSSTDDLIVADTMNNRLVQVALRCHTGGHRCRVLLDKAIDTPIDLAVTDQGGLLVLEQHGHRIVHLQPQSSRGRHTCVIERLKFPQGLTLDKFGNLLVADTEKHRIMYAPYREATRDLVFKSRLMYALGDNLLTKVASFL